MPLIRQQNSQQVAGKAATRDPECVARSHCVLRAMPTCRAHAEEISVGQSPPRVGRPGSEDGYAPRPARYDHKLGCIRACYWIGMATPTTDKHPWAPEPTSQQRRAEELVSLVEAVSSAEEMIRAMDGFANGDFSAGQRKLEDSCRALRAEITDHLTRCLLTFFRGVDPAKIVQYAEAILLNVWPENKSVPPHDARPELVSLLRSYASGAKVLDRA